MKINLLEALKAQGVNLEDGQDVFLNAVSEAMNKSFEQGNRSFKENLDNAIKAVVGETDKDDNGNTITLAQTIKSLAEQVDSLSQKFTINEESKKNLESIVKENYETIKSAMKSGKKFQFTFKDPAIHATNNGTVSNAQGVAYPASDNWRVIPGFSALARPEDMLMNYIQSYQRDVVNKTVILRQEVAGEGAFEIVDESGEKP